MLLAKEIEGRRTVKPAKTDFTSLLILLRATIAALVLEHGVVSFIIDEFYLQVYLLSAYRAAGNRSIPDP